MAAAAAAPPAPLPLPATSPSTARAASSGGAGGAAVRLVVHLDVNKTLIMTDPAAGASMQHLLNGMLAACAFGTVARADDGTPPTWSLLQPPMLSTTPSPGTVSYDTFLREVLFPAPPPPAGASAEERLAAHAFRQAQRERCKALVREFTSPGSPGAPFAAVHAALAAKLAIPPSDAAAARATAFHPFATGYRYLVPAYFVLLQWLAATQRSFLVVIRTFGSDIPDCVREHNLWLAGRHPLVPPPAPPMDAAALAIHCPYDTAVACRCGDASRDTRLAVVSGFAGTAGAAPPRTREEALTRALTTAGMPHAPAVPTAGDDSISALSFVVGYRPIADWLASRLRRSGGAALVVRDDWEWWSSHGELGQYGKLLPMDPTDRTTQHIFLDDNIGSACDARRMLTPAVLAAAGIDAAMFGERVDASGAAAAAAASDDAGIVDARDMHTSRPIPFAATRDVHLLRVDPISTILNDNYFVDLVTAAHARWQAQWAPTATVSAP